jgi:hypothetical protein
MFNPPGRNNKAGELPHNKTSSPALFSPYIPQVKKVSCFYRFRRIFFKTGGIGL